VSRKTHSRTTARVGPRSTKGPLAAGKVRQQPGGAVCRRCGAVFAARTWRRDHKVSLEFYDRARWVVCDACKEIRGGEGFGRVLLRGGFVAANEEAIRRRIQNVAGRAAFTQPQRRVSSISATPDGLEVVTTSQKLAHRIARELTKAFRGRATYRWADRDGSLLATWWAGDGSPARRRAGAAR